MKEFLKLIGLVGALALVITVRAWAAPEVKPVPVQTGTYNAQGQTDPTVPNQAGQNSGTWGRGVGGRMGGGHMGQAVMAGHMTQMQADSYLQDLNNNFQHLLNDQGVESNGWGMMWGTEAGGATMYRMHH